MKTSYSGQKRTNFALLRRTASESYSGEDQTATVDDVKKLDRQSRALRQASIGYFRARQLQAPLCHQKMPR
ncbi:hypothetical protein Acr_15g0002140 [Actinidia rufa]|uniref:Uncharacterized protein n=1 Tax=Actinidia rufa TaxID=165716 RepID=A0A7J0FSE5_9ERIC|nr:hypothetical protein Acr_15g0002140 [Actinidia rufa]